ncbi:hypothetical protein D3C80_1556870 [compost metagenome]
MLMPLGLQGLFGKHRVLQPEVAIALGLIEQRRTHLQQVRRAAARHDGLVEGLVPGVPEAEHFFGVAHFDDLAQGVRAGEDFRFPAVVAALDRQGQEHGLEVGAGVVDVRQLAQRHGRDPIAALADGDHQALRHQL